MRKTVVLGIFGSVMDVTSEKKRWETWRPTLSIFQHQELLVSQLELIHLKPISRGLKELVEDIGSISPETSIHHHSLDIQDPWDFEEVYGRFLDFAKRYDFDLENEDYLIHIVTGTHVAQICLFLLTEARYLPGRLLQTSPPKRHRSYRPAYSIIDLDLSRYDRIATRFKAELEESLVFLKSGIATRNQAFNAMIERIEVVAMRSRAPLLLMGPTGAGKSRLAKRIFELKRQRQKISGAFVEVNCATIRGDSAMSSLFGHCRGAFTGAIQERPGLLRSADGGVLFLDEIGELGLDEQAMLLRAIEEKRFLAVGSDREWQSDFQLIAGTNRDLRKDARSGRFRDDLLARIDMWTFSLPSLSERREDIEPNIHFELEQFAETHGTRVTFNKEAMRRFLAFALAPESSWLGNFRDLNAAITRMGTLAPGGRINEQTVEEEIVRLREAWHEESGTDAFLDGYFDGETLEGIDLFDRMQLAAVLKVTQRCSSLSAAGRILFAASRGKKKSANDADRLRKYLARFGLEAKRVLRPKALFED